ncbi:MAG: protease modulator HflC [Acidobacteriota bacterium]|nr:MAG: protease modulator HflC [Acidobacteriota bacterium]
MRALILLGLLALVVLIVVSGTFYVITEQDQAIIIRLGKPLPEPVVEPGLHVRVPLIDKVRKFDKRWLEWDGDRNEMPTKDKKYIFVDTYARWRIVDPLLFYQRVRDENGAQSRLDDIIDGATRNAIASYDLIEVVRTTNRPFEVTEELAELVSDQSEFQIKYGRDHIAQEILEKSAAITPDYGIELADVRFKRIDYVESVRQKVYDRMIAERKRIAEKNRSEGQGRAAEIRGEMERELRRIRSEAFRKTQELKGQADAEATKIYADAYSRDAELYGFLRTLETWEKTLDRNSRLLLSTDSEMFRYLKKAR